MRIAGLKRLHDVVPCPLPENVGAVVTQAKTKHFWILLLDDETPISSGSIRPRLPRHVHSKGGPEEVRLASLVGRLFHRKRGEGFRFRNGANKGRRRHRVGTIGWISLDILGARVQSGGQCGRVPALGGP